MSLLEKVYIRKVPYYKKKKLSAVLTSEVLVFQRCPQGKVQLYHKCFCIKKKLKTLGPHVLGKSVFNL